MASLNKKRIASDLGEDTRTTLNHEGEKVHALNNLEILLSKAQGSFMGEDGFYEKHSPEKDFAEIRDIIASLPQEDAEYALKIAAIGRASNMISYPLAILTACFNDPKFKGENFKAADGKTKFTGYTDKVVRRAKDVTEILANQIEMYGFDSTSDSRGQSRRNMPLPIQERKQLKRKLEEFDAYQISKALGKRRSVSMADAIKLLRPAGDKCEFFGQVINGKVSFGNGKKQVQSELAKLGAKKTSVENVKKSIKDTSLMAIVKNLVAMNRAGALDEETTAVICDKLSSKEAVIKSRIMPYQLYEAYIAMRNQRAYNANVTRIVNALVKAIDFSAENVDEIDGYTLFLVDLSGSMTQPVSGFSSMTAKTMAALLAAIGVKKSLASVYVFGSSCKRVNVSKESTIVDTAERILSCNVGGATYIDNALRVIKADGTNYDNLVVLSDGDCYSYSSKHGLVIQDWRGSADGTVSALIKSGMIKRFFINNLTGNKFSIVNTDSYRKNLVVGFTEKYIDSINFSILLQQEAKDIRNVINLLYEKYYK